MDGRGSVVPYPEGRGKHWSDPVAGKGPRSAYYYTTLHLALHIYRANPCPVPGRAKGGFNPYSLSPSQPRLTGPYLFRGESGASRSTVERKILGPSSFSTGVSAHMEAGQRWKRSNTGIRSKLAFLFDHFDRGGWRKWTKQTHISQSKRWVPFSSRQRGKESY